MHQFVLIPFGVGQSGAVGLLLILQDQPTESLMRFLEANTTRGWELLYAVFPRSVTLSCLPTLSLQQFVKTSSHIFCSIPPGFTGPLVLLHREANAQFLCLTEVSDPDPEFGMDICP